MKTMKTMMNETTGMNLTTPTIGSRLIRYLIPRMEMISKRRNPKNSTKTKTRLSPMTQRSSTIWMNSRNWSLSRRRTTKTTFRFSLSQFAANLEILNDAIRSSFRSHEPRSVVLRAKSSSRNFLCELGDEYLAFGFLFTLLHGDILSRPKVSSSAVHRALTLALANRRHNVHVSATLVGSI